MEVSNIKVKQFTVNEFFENLNISVKLKVSSFLINYGIHQKIFCNLQPIFDWIFKFEINYGLILLYVFKKYKIVIYSN